ncbi:tol-pal system protein YbgF [Zavarzinia sp.]|uniref:tol-pal system protein YbgF n=1 Tax=Zavarzinia sp. TaxID=2027920 RepID=UPI00356895ED
MPSAARRPLRLIAAGLLLAAGWSAGQAFAQAATDLGALRDKLAEISDSATEIQLAQAQGGINQAGVAQLDLRLSALEEQIRTLTGQIEQAQYAADQNKAALKSFQDDVEFRLNRLEQQSGVQAGGGDTGGAQGGTAGAAPAPAPAPTPAPAPGPTSSPAGGPSPATSSPAALAAYDNALGMLRRGDYDQAEAALKSFLASYGSDKLAGNAQYWLGETYYVRGNYDTAAQTFLSGVKTYPQGAKAPDSFLKLGMSLIQMGQKDKGCQVLSDLPNRYADASATIKSRADRERKAAACP